MAVRGPSPSRATCEWVAAATSRQSIGQRGGGQVSKETGEKHGWSCNIGHVVFSDLMDFTITLDSQQSDYLCRVGNRSDLHVATLVFRRE